MPGAADTVNQDGGAPDSPLHRVAFRFTDGVERVIDVAPGTLLLDAAIAANVGIIHQCRSGSCTSCTASLVSGAAKMRAASSALLAAEKAQGQRLLCMSEALGDCRFDLPYESTSAANTIRGHAFVDTIERIADNVIRLRLELAEGCWFDFKPGQFVQLRVPGTGVMRSYSIASTAADLPSIDLLIRLLPGGAMSEWLGRTAAVDQVLEIEGPFGSFFLRDRGAVPHLLVAGGTGLAPMLAIIDAIRARPGRKPPVVLSFGCTCRETLFSLETLALRRLWMPTLETRICIDRGSSDHEVRVGNPVAAAIDGGVDPASVAYLCGPPAMVSAARDALEAAGLSPDNIFAEQFVASS